MSQQFLKITFTDHTGQDLKRGVIVDDLELVEVYTATIIPVEGGPHEVSLVPPPDFAPPLIKVAPRGTTPANPLLVEFRQATAAAVEEDDHV